MLAEVSVPGDYSQPKTAPAQVDIELAMGLTYAEEQPFMWKVGVFQKNDFSEIRDNLKLLRDEEFLQPLVAPGGPVNTQESEVNPVKVSQTAPKKIRKPGREAGVIWTAKASAPRRPARKSDPSTPKAEPKQVALAPKEPTVETAAPTPLPPSSEPVVPEPILVKPAAKIAKAEPVAPQARPPVPRDAPSSLAAPMDPAAEQILDRRLLLNDAEMSDAPPKNIR